MFFNLKPYQKKLLFVFACLVCVFSVIISIFSDNYQFQGFLDDIGYSDDRCDGADGTFAFYSIGNADSCAVYNNNAFGLIDVGSAECAGEIREQLNNKYLETIDFIVITHPHSDHAGGYVHLVENFDVKRLYIPKCSPQDWDDYSLYQSIIQTSHTYDVEIVYIKDLTVANINGVQLSFFHPLPSYYNENERSVYVKVSIAGKSCLFTGDGGVKAENALVESHYTIGADILKVGHHGSKTATSDLFLTAVDPDYAVISVGWNSYGHPANEVLERLRAHSIIYGRTDLMSHIEFDVIEGKLTLVTQ